jgi:hypothetical protein
VHTEKQRLIKRIHATSATNEQYSLHDNIRFGHIIIGLQGKEMLVLPANMPIL